MSNPAYEQLSDKQKRFVDEYLIDQNATQAYMRAGYKVKNEASASAAGTRLLGNVRVRAAVDAGMAELTKKSRMSAEESWYEMGCIARSDLGDIFDFTGEDWKPRPPNQIPADAQRTMRSLEVETTTHGTGKKKRVTQKIKVTLWDKPEANVTNLKAHGELKEKVGGPGGGAIPMAVVGLYLPENGRDPSSPTEKKPDADVPTEAAQANDAERKG